MASPFGSFTFGKPAAPAPAFGTPAPAAGGLFGSSAPAAFGATASAFGAPSAPSIFGAASAAAPSPFGFGQSTTAFGAASTPGLSFGTPGANATPGAFGAASAPSLFGQASTPAPFGASSAPSLFGASSASAFGSMFGAASSAGTLAPGSAPSLFSTGASLLSGAAGAIVPAGQSPFGGITTQMAPAAVSVPMTQDAAIKEISEIRAAYNPASPTYRFQYLFLNVVDNPAQRIKPPNVDEMRWRQAMAQAGGPENPDRLWPVLALGFKDLLARSAAQAAAVDENSNRLKSLGDLAQRMARQHSVDLKQRASDVQRRHIELSHRLLHVTRLLDSLESRLAASLGYRGDVARAKESNLSRALASVEAELSPASASSLQRRLEAVGSAARLRAGAPAAASQAKLDERSMSQLFSVLKEHAEGVRQVQGVLKRDALDVEIMRQEVLGGAGGSGAALMIME